MPVKSATPVAAPAVQHLPASPASTAHTASHCSPARREYPLRPRSGIAPPPDPLPSATRPSSGSPLPGTHHSSRQSARPYPSAASAPPRAGMKILPPSPASPTGSGLRHRKRKRARLKVHPALSHPTLMEISPRQFPYETVFHVLVTSQAALVTPALWIPY